MTLWLFVCGLPFVILFVSSWLWKELKRVKKPTLEDRFHTVQELEKKVRELEKAYPIHIYDSVPLFMESEL
jgi:hypothetical protein